MSGWELVVFGVVGFVMAVFSGIAGGGGGFVMTPLGIFLGLTPAQAVSTGKFNGLSITLGSLFGMKSAHGQISKAKVIPVMALALAVGLLVPFVIKGLDSEVYRIILGVILLLMIPVVIIKKVGIKPQNPSPRKKLLGNFLLTIALFLQGAFSGGLGTLVNVVLMGMLGMTATEANLTKRWSQLILNVTIILGVVTSGLVVWNVAAVGAAATLTGGYLGGRIGTKKGDAFIMRVMVALMFVSAIALILGA